MRMFISGILLLNALKSNMEKLKKHNFEKKALKKFIFHKTKKWIVRDFNCEPLFNCDGEGMMNILILGVYI